jgi:SAM-dependent methyltransferase
LLQRVYEWLRRRVNHRLVGYLAEQICPPPGPPEPTIRVLEAGSGTAFATSVFSAQRAGTECVCMDIDEEALREARNRDAGVLAVVGDLRRMPFADGTFLLVFNSSTVEHLEDPSLAVAEMRRVCARSGGRVFVGVPYRYGPLWFQPLIRATRLGVWLGPVFSRATLHRLLRGVGLRPIADRRYFGRFFLGTVAERGA